jgi:hypothetical protein
MDSKVLKSAKTRLPLKMDDPLIVCLQNTTDMKDLLATESLSRPQKTRHPKEVSTPAPATPCGALKPPKPSRQQEVFTPPKEPPSKKQKKDPAQKSDASSSQDVPLNTKEALDIASKAHNQQVGMYEKMLALLNTQLEKSEQRNKDLENQIKEANSALQSTLLKGQQREQTCIRCCG